MSPPVHGRNGRLGLVVPANNTVIEPEFWSALPADVVAYATRIPAKGDLTPEAVRLMEEDADSAVAVIASTGVDVIAYCDMVTTFIMEEGWNEAAVDRFRKQTGTPVVSAWTSLRDALARLGAKRLAIGTPYPYHIHALVRPFFKKHGFEVHSDETLDIVAMRDVPTVDSKRLAAFVESLDRKGCDAVVLLATDLPTFGSIVDLEAVTGLPVVTSNQALLWATLGAVRRPLERPLGRLFGA